MRTVNDLIEALTDLVNQHPAAGNLPLLVAMQPSYPLMTAFVGARVTVPAACDGKEPARALVLVSGTAAYGVNPYGDKSLWDGEGGDLTTDWNNCDAQDGYSAEYDDELALNDKANAAAADVESDGAPFWTATTVWVGVAQLRLPGMPLGLPAPVPHDVAPGTPVTSGATRIGAIDRDGDACWVAPGTAGRVLLAERSGGDYYRALVSFDVLLYGDGLTVGNESRTGQE